MESLRWLHKAASSELIGFINEQILLSLGGGGSLQMMNGGPFILPGR